MKEDKPDGYFEHQRPEMLRFIDIDVRSVLDMGCGAGGYLNLLREKFPGIETWGIEIDEAAGSYAQSQGHNVLIGNGGDLLAQVPDGHFDLISCNDVLEHFTDPYSLLRQLRTKLKPGGRLISSLPNIRYYKPMFRYVFKGDWKYEPAGVMDNTHFRFFTKVSIERMYREAGFKILRNEGINAGKSSKPAILNLLAFGTMPDIKYPQVATVVTH